ncbi:MAG: DUF3467 domain-containing protein [Ilumatobacteraceae bacterium]
MATERMAGYEWRVPDDEQGGRYANLVGVWHSAHEFTLDFATTQQPEQRNDGIVVPVQVTSRVKLPVSVLFDLIRALNENMTKYEQVYGPISRPGDNRPTYPPDDLVGG